jgi:hypothetical protein
MPTATVDLLEISRPPIQQITMGAGLCRTCVKAPECTFPRDPKRPVRSCDEFEGVDGPRLACNPPMVAASVIPLTGGSEKMTPEMRGLCVQCARRHTCAYPKPVGGVWHCDELA